MFGLFALTGIIAAIVALSAVLGSDADRDRLARARDTLRRAGYRFERGSEAEARALRIVLEGDALESI